MRKPRCSRGISCRYSCIERSDVCRVEFGNQLSDPLTQTSKLISEARSSAPTSKEPKASAAPSGGSRQPRSAQELAELKDKVWKEILRLKREGGNPEELQSKMEAHKKISAALKNASASSPEAKGDKEDKAAKVQANSFDMSFKPTSSTAGTSSSFDWSGSLKDSKVGGAGGFGSVMFNGNVAIKRGEIGKHEMDALLKVGKVGLGPELIYGETGRRAKPSSGLEFFTGRVAMTKVEGSPILRYSPTTVMGGRTVSDLAIKARADLHRMGIAHGDMRGDNIFISDKGGKAQVKIVDFGFAQNNWKAALSEALGLIVNHGNLPKGADFKGIIEGDFQARKGTSNFGYTTDRSRMSNNLRAMNDNLERVKSHLMDNLGLSPSQTASIMTSGIKNPDRFYAQGDWAKLSDKDAKTLIGMLYKGVQ